MIEIIPSWHPLFVHFPIAFATAALVLIFAGTLFGNRPWAAQSLMSGRLMLWGAAIFACVAAVFGWFAYNSVEHDDAGHLAMRIHRNWALVAVAVLVSLAALDAWLKKFTTIAPYGFVALLFVAWVLVINVAWHGGELVYRHGLGVMSLPEPEGVGHTHEHGEEHDGMPAQGAAMAHADDHAHEETTTGANIAPKKTGHTHAPGTSPHKD
jgi:uncharacterized membrane protein